MRTQDRYRGDKPMTVRRAIIDHNAPMPVGKPSAFRSHQRLRFGAQVPMLTRLARVALILVLAIPSLAWAQEVKPKIKLGFSKCAHCFAMSLLPGLSNKVDIDAINFNTGNDVLTGLVSKSVDV